MRLVLLLPAMVMGSAALARADHLAGDQVLVDGKPVAICPTLNGATACQRAIQAADALCKYAHKADNWGAGSSTTKKLPQTVAGMQFNMVLDMQKMNWVSRTWGPAPIQEVYETVDCTDLEKMMKQ